MKAALSQRSGGKPGAVAPAAGAAVKPGGRTGNFKKLAAACLVLSLGIILAYHFFLFWTVGRVIIEEPNRFILCLESALSAGIIAFGLEQLLRG